MARCSRSWARARGDDALGFEDCVLLAIPANERRAAERGIALAVQCCGFIFPIGLRGGACGLRAGAEQALAGRAALKAWFAHGGRVALMVMIAVVLVGMGAGGSLASDQRDGGECQYGTECAIGRHQGNSLFNKSSTMMFDTAQHCRRVSARQQVGQDNR